MSSSASLADVANIMRQNGAEIVIFKILANNDNSKQQIYFGSDFTILQAIPTGDIYEDGYSEKKGAIFKAKVDLNWVDLQGNVENAPGAQFILYPKYPEVRLSGFVRGCGLAPGHLMQPPTPEERKDREVRQANRCLVLGIRDKSILAYVSSWEDNLSKEAAERIRTEQSERFTSVFYEYADGIRTTSTREKLINRLSEIHNMGFIESCRLDKDGNRIPYVAQNSAGLTLESFFGITPNGRSEPDFMDWELKAHSSGAVTLMTPEPDTGSYLEDLSAFMDAYATSRTDEKINFASIHRMNEPNARSSLTMQLVGFNRAKSEITDPKGGMLLTDPNGNIAAGWSFQKLLTHWKRKHANTCYVVYQKEDRDVPYFAYGPSVKLCTGAGIKNYLNALSDSVIYYDPGINMKLKDGKWKGKKRNQFRIKWKDVSSIYDSSEDVILS
ncbi:MvaI/BcnI family restriction endonuclease [Marinobacter nauticus]|uniref:MvaI/BcnI family restriction endonuclease n=1 Tax=Marinobacter nauticus TaxID=2743 RepID=UPI001C938260|nr:MvaI/BcnI family restriction endonuclease [Marinobacter nauticus]MBY6220015.1 MvaI/BcnI restriction endonuclease family protein [Marinobacter nauticus]